MSSREPKTKQIELPEGWTARVGCSDADNDELTFRSSFPQDWWLHVNGCPGSHVVLHHAEGGEPPKEVLEMAAILAARNSKARNAGKASVHVARICDLHKPRGAAPGSVEVRRGRTLKVRWTP